MGALPPCAAQRYPRPSARPLRSRLCRPGDPPPLHLAPPILAEGQGCDSRAAQPAVLWEEHRVAVRGGGARVCARRPSPRRQPLRLLPASVGLGALHLRTLPDECPDANASAPPCTSRANCAWPTRPYVFSQERSHELDRTKPISYLQCDWRYSIISSRLSDKYRIPPLNSGQCVTSIARRTRAGAHRRTPRKIGVQT